MTRSGMTDEGADNSCLKDQSGSFCTGGDRGVTRERAFPER